MSSAPDKSGRTLPRFLTEREVASITGMSVKTLQRWRVYRRGPAYVKLGGRSVRYSDAALKEWISSCPTGGGTQ